MAESKLIIKDFVCEFEEEMFSADEQSDVEEASQEAPVEKGADVDMT